MFKALRRQRWTCPHCLHIQQRHLRGLAAAVQPQPATPSDTSPASFSPPSAQHDDRTLRQIFDNPALGREFAQKTSAQFSGKRAGLFLNQHLTHPEGFKVWAESTLRKCYALTDKMLRASTVEEYKSMARDMDRLSDLFCRVIDLVDFVRATHSDAAFRASANSVWSMMMEVMNTFNTHGGLSVQLKRALGMPEVVGSWSEEEKVVAGILMRDFERSMVRGEGEREERERNAFVEISNEIAEVGSEFVDGVAPEKEYLQIEGSKLKGMGGRVLRESYWRRGVLLPTVGKQAVLALQTVDDPDVRKEVYIAHRTASKSSILRLEKMLKARSRLAKLTGYESYTHLALSNKMAMAKTPEAVTQFLEALAAETKPRILEELQQLLALKRKYAPGSDSNTINAWDREYYNTILHSGLIARVRGGEALSNYFSLGTVFQGLSRLFSRLYGIRLVPCETQPGETWHEDVRRLDVVDEAENHIAVVYCDLFSRASKNPNPTHFTIRCSRAIPEEEVAEFADTPGPFSNPVEAATEGMAHFRDPSSGVLYQLPTMALICDFSRRAHIATSSAPGAPKKPTLLSFQDVETLFHEMGHALQSILGRTQLHNVSGTRCATDFAELPSVLMEHFSFAPQALGLWARHWETDAALPWELVREKMELERRVDGQTTEAQILLAVLDQACHSQDLENKQGEGWSTEIFHDVWDKYGSVPEPSETKWQGFFGHLYGYGATYYAYLFDRVIARRVWSVVFGDGERSIDRTMGERYKEEVLKWGGGRDPWMCVAAVLGDERLAEGGEEAMREVGRWGVNGNKRI